MLQRNELAEHEFQLLPNRTVAYGFDWKKWLVTEKILTSDWTATGGINFYGGAILAGDEVTAVYVDGGVNGEFYSLTNTITTATRTGVQNLTLSCHPGYAPFTAVIDVLNLDNGPAVGGFSINPVIAPPPRPSLAFRVGPIPGPAIAPGPPI